MSSFSWSPLQASGGGVSTYANLAAFPSAASAGNGALAIALDTNILYESNGSAWVAIAGPGAVLSIGSPANGLSITSDVLTLGLSSTSTIGALSNTDWNTFNNKQSALTFGALSDAGTDGITVTGGTGAVIGSGTSIAQHVADTTHNGYLSSTDWNTFNGKQAAGNYITALTGDGTASGPGSVALTLATVNANVGSFGTASSVSAFTVTAKGLITAASNTSIQIAESQVTNLVTDLAAKQSTTLTSAHLLVGNVSNVATDVAASGDLTLANTGAFTLAKVQGTVVSGTTGSVNVVFSSAPTLSNPIVGTQSQGDASTKAASTAYVDTAVANAIAGVNPAVAVQAATTAASDTSSYAYSNGASGIGATLTGPNNTALTVDGFTFTAVNQRILVKNDTQSPSGAFNGVYYVNALQTAITGVILIRALDYDTPSDMNNTGAIPVVNGTVNGTTSWVLTSQITTVGTSSLTFTKFTRNPADYLLVANNLSDVATKATAFNNLSPMTTSGDIIYGGASGTGTRLAANSTGTNKYLQSVSSGIPSWQQINASDLTGTLSTSNGGTGQTSLNSTVFTTLFETVATTGGDLIYGGASGAPTRLANGSSGQFLKSNGTTLAPSWAAPTIALTNPTIQKFTAGSGTYTTPASVLYLKVTVVGAGGGGYGSGSAGGTAPTAGGDSFWRTSGDTNIVQAFGGGVGGFGGNGGAGGAAPTISAGATDLGSRPGAQGAGSSYSGTTNAQSSGGNGGGNAYCGSGGGGGAAGTAPPSVQVAGQGGGGGGSNNVSAGFSGNGGGGGAYGYVFISSPSATYHYVVGAAGGAGAAGTSGIAGAAGGAGIIIVEEYYQ